MQTILYVVNQLRKSGPVIVLQNIIRHLDRTRFKPLIVKLMKDDPDRSITSQFIEMDVKVFELGYSFKELELRPSKVAREVERLAKKCKADVIHTHGYHPVLVAAQMKGPYVRMETLHCICLEDFVFSKGVLLGRYMNWRYLRNLNRLDAAAAISQSVGEFYRPILSHTKVHLVYNGVETTQFKLVTGLSKVAMREKLGLPSGRNLFISVGALSAGKDPCTIIEAYKKAFHPDDPQAPLLLFLGQGVLAEKCKKMVVGWDSVIFKGYVFNPNEYLQAADYSVSASQSEGFGLNIIESLLCGVPTICSNIGPSTEFVAPYPALKQLQFRVGNLDELKEKLREVNQSPINMTGIIEDVAKRFSAQRMSGDYMELYTNITKKNDANT